MYKIRGTLCSERQSELTQQRGVQREVAAENPRELCVDRDPRVAEA